MLYLFIIKPTKAKLNTVLSGLTLYFCLISLRFSYWHLTCRKIERRTIHIITYWLDKKTGPTLHFTKFQIRERLTHYNYYPVCLIAMIQHWVIYHLKMSNNIFFICTKTTTRKNNCSYKSSTYAYWLLTSRFTTWQITQKTHIKIMISFQ